ncbi:MAG: carbohydrate binding family 9 domain-containing protein [Saprospiraceae bacterium]|nr:carbohydrate binding family 9 domain-containing protein [Saprospiraceae bacterium]
MAFFGRTGWILLLLGTGMSSTLAQESTDIQKDYQIHIRPVEGDFLLDGRPDEAFWMNADSVNRFWLKSPRLEADAEPATVVRLAYDDDFLYVAAWCVETEPVNVQTLRRDVDYFRGDGFGVVLDPINKHTYGYFFGSSPYGTQIDGILLGIGQDVSTSWDGTFYTETQRSDRGWTLEMAIPLRTLRFDAENRTWGIQFVRNVITRNEVQTWTPVPLQFGPLDINFTGQLIWQDVPGSQITNVSVIPYLLAGTQKEPSAQDPVSNLFQGGIDARIGLGSALNLDLTLNPDFSQVDIDEQPVNLTRFNIRLPERRTFFLENTDVFSEFSLNTLRPFFSRRIGLDDEGGTVPILYGARLSGNVSSATRIGVLNMQTGSSSSTPSQNYSAVSVNQQIFSRSRIAAPSQIVRPSPKDNSRRPIMDEPLDWRETTGYPPANWRCGVPCTHHSNRIFPVTRCAGQPARPIMGSVSKGISTIPARGKISTQIWALYSASKIMMPVGIPLSGWGITSCTTI